MAALALLACRSCWQRCAAGAALGWLASFIGQYFYLIFVFPLGIGFGLVTAGGLFVAAHFLRPALPF